MTQVDPFKPVEMLSLNDAQKRLRRGAVASMLADGWLAKVRAVPSDQCPQNPAYRFERLSEAPIG